jgi:metal-responsive CopG/Arc/MetJ family transcriptional regulator
MKTAISIPDPLFNSAERAARRLHVSRSKLFATAVSHYLGQVEHQDVTERLNNVYGSHGSLSELPEGIRRMQAMSLAGEKW